jgi:sugar lactone lactonase YvrE
MNFGLKASLGLGLSTALLGVFAAPSEAFLLVANSEGNRILVVEESNGAVLGDFVTPGAGGLRSPDDLTFGPDGNLYVSMGGSNSIPLIDPTYPTDSAVLRFSPTGEFLGVAASGNGLTRPYGNAFGPDGNLYVASFRSNEILRFNGTTGAFIDVFASDNNGGFGVLDGLNGPNGLLFGPDGSLYVTTEGTVNKPDGTLDFKFKSQVLRYTPDQVAGTVSTLTPQLFIDQPPVLADSFGFVSLLGLELSPDGKNLFVSDFAGGIREYDLATGTFLNLISTNYTGTNPSSNFIGGLTFGTGAFSDTLFSLGFNNSTGADNIGTVLAFANGVGSATSFTGAAFTDARLVRPIGLTATAVPEPTTIAGVGLALAGCAARLRKRRQADA